jgi:cation-transporting ATPase I
LLLGGNLGEIGMIAGAAVLGRGQVLSARQILAINLVTDVLPAVSVAVQPPRALDLHKVALQSGSSFDAQLRRDILRRGIATSASSLAALLLAGAIGAQVPVVAFGSIVATQLAQTLQLGSARARAVTATVSATAAALAAALTLSPIRGLLALPAPAPSSFALIAASGPVAALTVRALGQR